MKKSASAVSVIGGADGPSSIFFKKNAKLTLKQKIQRAPAEEGYEEDSYETDGAEENNAEADGEDRE